MRVPVSMATPGLDKCPACNHLIVKSEAGWLDVFISAGPWYADTGKLHEHQPEAGR